VDPSTRRAVALAGKIFRQYAIRPTLSGNHPCLRVEVQSITAATPIFEGGGVGNGTVQYVKYIGIVSRYNQYGGFGNGWIASCNNNTSTSNDYLQYINCIADGNGINGIAHYCATGLLIQQSILAHNGNGADSWSSVVSLLWEWHFSQTISNPKIFLRSSAHEMHFDMLAGLSSHRTTDA
jgi:hypothetical protein